RRRSAGRPRAAVDRPEGRDRARMPAPPAGCRAFARPCQAACVPARGRDRRVGRAQDAPAARRAARRAADAAAARLREFRLRPGGMRARALRLGSWVGQEPYPDDREQPTQDGYKNPFAGNLTSVVCRPSSASVPIPKFAIPCSTLSCELRNQRDTSKVMILVPLLNPKFALGFAASVCELRVRGTSANVNTALAHDAWMPYLRSLFALGSMVVCVRFRNSHSDPWFCRTAGCRLEDAMSAAYRVGNGPSGLAARFEPRAAWRRAYDAVRSETARRAAPLTAEDQAVQSMPD